MAESPKSLSLYAHVPFCVRKCRYCDFYSIPYDNSDAERFVQALAQEWELVKKEFKLDNSEIRTIFFGGGTPSMLSIELWEQINTILIKNLHRATDCEWTIECNPDSFTEDKAEQWLSMGVTRLTFGIQSLDDRELTVLGRPHTAAQALAVLKSPILSAFKSIGIDLMYGLPGQTVDSFEKSLQAALSFPVVSHLSAYELTVNPQTPFGRHASKISFPSEETALAMSQTLYAQSKAMGFERYEISNFGKPGHRCRHNEAYWSHSPYIGLGPAAHSYVPPQRWANVKNISHYLTDIGKSKRPLEFTEIINAGKLASETIFLRLRTLDGLDENVFKAQTGRDFYSSERAVKLDDMIKRGLISRTPPMWSLTGDGMLLADAIAKRLV
jgi:oxygen-independent coproporphyrinogen-3 oxidase